MLHVIYQSIFAPLGVINREPVKGRLGASVITVSVTAILGAVVAPAVYFYANRNRYELNLNIRGMLLGLSVSVATWLLVCAMFWLLSKAYKKGVGFKTIAATWGLSYIPNLLCIVLYYLLIIVPGMYDGSGILAFVFSALFILFLVWKAIYYFMLMRFVLDTSLGEFLAVTAVSAVVFVGLMILGFKVGIRIPML